MSLAWLSWVGALTRAHGHSVRHFLALCEPDCRVCIVDTMLGMVRCGSAWGNGVGWPCTGPMGERVCGCLVMFGCLSYCEMISLCTNENAVAIRNYSNAAARLVRQCQSCRTCPCPTERTDSPSAHAPMLGQHRLSAIGCQCWPDCLGSLAMLGYARRTANVDHAADGREPWPCGGGLVPGARDRGEGGPAQPGQRKRTPHKNFLFFIANLQQTVLQASAILA